LCWCGVAACRAVGGGLRSGAALVDVRLDVVPLPPRSSSPTAAGCPLGGFPAGRDRWGGERIVGGVLPRINIGADVWGESSIMTGTVWGGGPSLHPGIEFGRSRTGEGSSGGTRKGVV
jgi:hypothetical protein